MCGPEVIVNLRYIYMSRIGEGKGEVVPRGVFQFF